MYQTTPICRKSPIFAHEQTYTTNNTKTMTNMTCKHFAVGAVVGLLAFVATPTVLKAQGTVVTVNGERVEHVLVRMTFEGDNVVLHFADGADSQRADMASVAVELPLASGVPHVGTLGVARMVGDELVLGGVPEGERIALYDATGRLRLKTAAASTTTTLSLAGFKAGVYIVKVGSNIIKFRKK